MTTGPFLALLLLIWGAVITEGSLWELNKMIKDVTGRNSAFNYGAYGCYCGWKGKGTPLDATDRCCHRHDCCYISLVKKGCKPKTDFYSYTFRSGNVQCGSGSSCEKQICNCDRVFTLCLKRNLSSYNTAYRFYSNSKCKGSQHKC